MSETPRPDDWTAVLDAVSIYAPSGDAAQRVMRKVDAARAAEHEQHQREIAQRDETIRQLRARERELESAVDSAQALARAFAASEARCATLTTTLEEARQHLAAIGWSMSGGTNLRDRIDAALAAAPQGRETPDPQKGELTDVEM